MAPSQLKRLKTSLREQGIVGPQQSKKQKKQTSKNGVTKEKRVQRNAVLEKLREQFNPFEVKKPARPNKYEFVKASTNGSAGKGVVGRPGVTKGLGEETVRFSCFYLLVLGTNSNYRDGKPYWSKCSVARKLEGY